MAEFKMAEFKMAEFKMADIIGKKKFNFLVTHIAVLLSFIDWKYTGKLDKIFSKDFEIWILILLKIYIT